MYRIDIQKVEIDGKKYETSQQRGNIEIIGKIVDYVERFIIKD